MSSFAPSLLAAATLFGLASSLSAQNATPADAPPPQPAAQGAPSASSSGPPPSGDGNRGGPGMFDRSAMMAKVRDAFGVTDDAEWELISSRIMAVFQLQGAANGGRGIGMMIMIRGADNLPPGLIDRFPELASLMSAIEDKMPAAEIKSRLDHYREVRKANEVKLTKAQDDLRAVLSVSQEAEAVALGLLP